MEGRREAVAKGGNPFTNDELVVDRNEFVRQRETGNDVRVWYILYERRVAERTLSDLGLVAEPYFTDSGDYIALFFDGKPELRSAPSRNSRGQRSGVERDSWVAITSDHEIELELPVHVDAGTLEKDEVVPNVLYKSWVRIETPKQ